MQTGLSPFDAGPSPRHVRRRHPVVTSLIVLATLAGLALVVSGGVLVTRFAADARDRRDTEQGATGCDPSDEPGDTRSLCLFEGRPDRQETDHEAEVGAPVRLAGYTAVLEKGFVHELVLADQLGIRVRVENRDDRPQHYGPLDWKIQTADGGLVNPTTNERDDSLGTGELEQGEVVEGTLLFELAPGTYYVLYRPDLFNRARGVWQITVEEPT